MPTSFVCSLVIYIFLFLPHNFVLEGIQEKKQPQIVKSLAGKIGGREQWENFFYILLTHSLTHTQHDYVDQSAYSFTLFRSVAFAGGGGEENACILCFAAQQTLFFLLTESSIVLKAVSDYIHLGRIIRGKVWREWCIWSRLYMHAGNNQFYVHNRLRK